MVILEWIHQRLLLQMDSVSTNAMDRIGCLSVATLGLDTIASRLWAAAPQTNREFKE